MEGTAPFKFKGLQGIDDEILLVGYERITDAFSEKVVLNLRFAPQQQGEFNRTLRVLDKEGADVGRFTVVAQVVP